MFREDPRRLFSVVIATGFAAGLAPRDASAGKMYWSEGASAKIRRAELDGTVPEDLITSPISAPSGIAVDSGAGKIYWADLNQGTIRRSNLDGSAVELLVTGQPSLTFSNGPSGITLDSAAGKMYWTNTSDDSIRRANLDGSGIETIYAAANPQRLPGSIAVEPITGKIFWAQASGSNATIYQADLDGANPAAVPVVVDGVAALAVESTSGKIYWAEGRDDRIRRANLDGSAREDLVIGAAGFAVALALDVARGKMYWLDSVSDTVRRANLDGTQVEDLLTMEFFWPRGIALDATNATLYWTDFAAPIRAANLDGSNVQDVVDGPFTHPTSMAIDLSGEKIYWADQPPFASSIGRIQRASLDGSNLETLVTTQTYDVVISAGMIYWYDSLDSVLRRANLDGSNPQNLFNLSPFDSFAIDAEGSKIYYTLSDWPNPGTMILRSNLDGTGKETLISSGLNDAGPIELDLPAGKMYWLDRRTDKVLRANLDGSHVEILIATSASYYGMALDFNSGHIYLWGHEIHRVRVDGGQFDRLFDSSEASPSGLVVDPDPCQSHPSVAFVDPGATGANDGSSWTDAFTNLQSAIFIASVPCKGVKEIWVAEGVYTPVRLADADDLRSASIVLVEGVGIYGGFTGTETSRSQRRPGLHHTILTGDLAGDDASAGSTADNAYHVVTVTGVDATAVLDGFVITGGNSNLTGGGIHIGGGNPTVANCMFIGNAAVRSGAGLYNLDGSPTLINCTFVGNRQTGALGGLGGAAVHNDAGHPRIVNCTFAGNRAAAGGGVLLNTTGGSPIIDNCIFFANRDRGGIDASAQVHTDSGTPVVNFSCVQGGWSGAGGTGNITDDPLFVRDPDDGGDGWGTGNDDDFGDLHLQVGSPCVDAGDNAALPTGVQSDLDGNLRVINGAVDMGAFEMSAPPPVPTLSAASVAVLAGLIFLAGIVVRHRAQCR